MDLVLEIRKPKVNFRHADRLQASFVLIVAPSEWVEGKVRAYWRQQGRLRLL